MGTFPFCRDPGTVAWRFPFLALSGNQRALDVAQAFVGPITGEDVDAYVFGPIERLIGTTVTMTCDKCGAIHSWPAEEGRAMEGEKTGDEGDYLN